MSTCEYFLSANDAGLNSAAWKTIPENYGQKGKVLVRSRRKGASTTV